MEQKKKAVIFGAGRTGRGFIGYLCAGSGYHLTLVDTNKNLIAGLDSKKKYEVTILGDESKSRTISNFNAYALDETTWMDAFNTADVAFVSIVGSNFPSLAPSLVMALERRRSVNPQGSFTIITCENYNNAARYLKTLISEKATDTGFREWMEAHVGISESMILCTSLNAAEGQDKLTVRSQAFFELPCDGDAFKGGVPGITGLKPLQKFGNQLERKIYTYNCINAVISYMGGVKGCSQLSEATANAAIYRTALQAGSETSKALIAEYGFEPGEQEAWVASAINKFADRAIPDPIDRNAGDVKRKLSRNDRLIGPALFCLKHNIRPDAILKGIVAAFHYDDKGYKVVQDIERTGIEAVLQNICGLRPEEQLYSMIVDEYRKKN